MIAVVGSLGKTTTQRAVDAVLGNPERRGNYRNFGACVASRLLQTPPWRRHASVEAGIDRPGQMAAYARMVKPWATVVTAVASEHHRSLLTLEKTRDEKAHMVRALPANGWALLNGDDPNVAWMRQTTRARVLTYGFGEACDFRARDYRLAGDPPGIAFEAWLGEHWQRLHSRLLGRHMVYPLLAALGVARITETPLEMAVRRLQELAPTRGRMEAIPLAGGGLLLRDDFKSTLETIHTALDVLAELPARRKIVVLGDVSEPPGPAGPIYREIGRRVATIAEHAIFIGTAVERYAAEARRQGMPDQAMRQFRDHRLLTALAEVRSLLREGDVVLVKGRYTQRLARLSLALTGAEVNCGIPFCDARAVDCDGCPMLERGWGDRRAVV